MLQGLHLPRRAALNHQYSDASFATLRVLSCLYSSGLRCSCCNVVRFCSDLEACNLVTATIVQMTSKYMKEGCEEKEDSFVKGVALRGLTPDLPPMRHDNQSL
jgi:hypothetical protein